MTARSSPASLGLIGNYMDAAVKCGVNMILTPVLTPPLDTAVGTERPTVQLVDIEVRDGSTRSAIRVLTDICPSRSKGNEVF